MFDQLYHMIVKHGLLKIQGSKDREATEMRFLRKQQTISWTAKVTNEDVLRCAGAERKDD